MISDTDFSIIMLKLEKFEDKLKKLEKEIEALKPKTTYAVAGGCLVCGRYDCISAKSNLPCPSRTVYSEPYYGDPPYALSSGSLSDSGTKQVWMNNDIESLLKQVKPEVTQLFQNLVPDNSEVEVGDVYQGYKRAIRESSSNNGEIRIGGYFPMDEDGNYIQLAKEGQDVEE